MVRFVCIALLATVLCTSSPVAASFSSCGDVPIQRRTTCSALDGVNKDVSPVVCKDAGCCYASNTTIPCFQEAKSRLQTDDPQCHDGFRIDCGYLGIGQEECEAKNCCWSPVDGPVDLPWCFFKQTMFTYQIVSDNTSPDGLKRTIMLRLSGDDSQGDVLELRVDISFDTVDQVRVKISDPNQARFEVPQEVLPIPEFPPPALDDVNYQVVINDDPFTFQIVRKDDGSVIFDAFSLIFRQHSYLSLSTRVPEQANIYGLGERVHSKFRLTQDFLYTLWALDNPAPLDQNLYGHHPFYLEMRDGKAHGVFLNNANGMDVSFHGTQSKDVGAAIQYHVIGGIFDFYFFVGPNPEQVTQQYHNLIGKPHVPPYFSLGWHQCRYGFKNLEEVETVVAEYVKADIPLETIWIDIDYMDQFEDFTTDPVNFPLPELQDFARRIHEANQFLIAIIDPAIHVREGYEAYDSGVAADIFTKDKNGELFVGRVWPGDTTFPDWSNPDSRDWWKGLILDWVRNDLAIDGIWIDMNEAASFCNGACYPSENQTSKHTYRLQRSKNGVFEQNLAESKFRDPFDPNNPVYRINNAASRADLNLKTLDMDAQLTAGIEFDLHNLFGAWESIYTREAAEEMNGKKAFVLSRSTYAGSGAHVGHWLGDNFSSFNDLLWSVMGLLSFNLFGIPMTGADICGFNGNTNEELCARWHALGAFYTFARNHNAIGEEDQEPYLWESSTIVLQNCLRVRYEILPWMYSLFFQANEFGGTVQRALFFEFPEDAATYDIADQFFFGSSFLVSPVVQEGATERELYFPSSVWYSYWNGERVPPAQLPGSITLRSEVFNGFSAEAPPILLHVRAGAIIPRQEAGYTLADARQTPFNLLVALDDPAASTTGSEILYYDDGETLAACNNGTCLKVLYEIQAGPDGLVLSGNVLQQFNTGSLPRLSRVTVLGAPNGMSAYANGRELNVVRRGAFADIPLDQDMNQSFSVVLRV